MQEFLLSEETQNQIADLGRRTGLGGVVKNADQNIFNPEWGINTETPLVPIKFPTEDVIQEALTLYQTSFKKPSFTVFALDFSGSMAGDGGEELKLAISTLSGHGEGKLKNNE